MPTPEELLQELKARIAEYFTFVLLAPATDAEILEVVDTFMNSTAGLPNADIDILMKSVFPLASKGEVAGSPPTRLIEAYNSLYAVVRVGTIGTRGTEGDFNAAWDNFVRGQTGLSPAARSNLDSFQSDVRDAWVALATTSEDPRVQAILPGEYLKQVVGPSLDNTGVPGVVVADPNLTQIFREALAEAGILPFDPSEEWQTQFNQQLGRFRTLLANIDAHKAVLTQRLQTLTPEQAGSGEQEKIQAGLKQLESLGDASFIAPQFTQFFATEQELEAQEAAEEEERQLATRAGREARFFETARDTGAISATSTGDDVALLSQAFEIAEERFLKEGGDFNEIVGEVLQTVPTQEEATSRLSTMLGLEAPGFAAARAAGGQAIGELRDRQTANRELNETERAALKTDQDIRRANLIAEADALKQELAGGVGAEREQQIQEELGRLNEGFVILRQTEQDELEAQESKERQRLISATEILEAASPVVAPPSAPATNVDIRLAQILQANPQLSIALASGDPDALQSVLTDLLPEIPKPLPSGNDILDQTQLASTEADVAARTETIAGLFKSQQTQFPTGSQFDFTALPSAQQFFGVGSAFATRLQTNVKEDNRRLLAQQQTQPLSTAQEEPEKRRGRRSFVINVPPRQ